MMALDSEGFCVKQKHHSVTEKQKKESKSSFSEENLIVLSVHYMYIKVRTKNTDIHCEKVLKRKHTLKYSVIFASERPLLLRTPSKKKQNDLKNIM